MTVWTRRVGTALAALALGACSAGEFRPVTSAPSYPPYRGAVRALERLPREGTFERLGTVTATGATYTGDAALEQRLKDEASRRGANAIVIQGPARTVTYRDGGLQRKIGAFAIRLVP